MPMRANRRRAPLLAVAAVFGAAALGLTACGSSTPHRPTAAALLKKALSNAVAQGWVHEVASESSGSTHLRTDNIIGTTSGRQLIVNGDIVAHVLFVDNIVYVEGTKDAIVHYFGIPTKNPAAIAGKWISVQSSDTGFTQLSGGVMLKTDFAQYKLTGTLTRGAEVVLDGQKVYPIHGTVNGTTIRATMYVTATGTTLPVEIEAKTTKIDSSIRWSQWGIAVSLSAPATSIPFSSVE